MTFFDGELRRAHWPGVGISYVRIKSDSALRVYTFWDYLRNAWGRNAGLRLDHLLLSPHLQDCLIDANVDREVRGWDKASDHAPAWVTISQPRG